MGVAQLVQTPAGAPASDPQRMFAEVEAKRLGRLVWASMVIMAAPNGMAKYIPKRLVQSQLVAVRRMRSGAGMSSVTLSSASKEMAPLMETVFPACSFLRRAG